MDSFLFAFPSDSFHINIRALACIFSSSIIIRLLIFLLLNTSATSLPRLLPPSKGNTRKVLLISLSSFFGNSYNLFSCLSSVPKGTLDNAKYILPFPIRFSSSKPLSCSYQSWTILIHVLKCFIAQYCRITPVQSYSQVSIRTLNTFTPLILWNTPPKSILDNCQLSIANCLPGHAFFVSRLKSSSVNLSRGPALHAQTCCSSFWRVFRSSWTLVWQVWHPSGQRLIVIFWVCQLISGLCSCNHMNPRMRFCLLRLVTAKLTCSACPFSHRITSTASVMEPDSFGEPSTL